MTHIQILGTRGIPSNHGGFETFAQDLALYLVDKGYPVTVYCQDGPDAVAREDMWRGVRRVHVPAGTGAGGTIFYDWKSVLHSCREDGVALTLGYNTAVFSALYRLRGHSNVMNMDGIEWKRDKWSWPEKQWLKLNEWLGARLAHHLIADHPAIAEHLYRHTDRSKIRVIPYGSPRVDDADTGLLKQFDLVSKGYYLMVARPEPENSVLEVIQGYSARERTRPLAVLGHYEPSTSAYHSAVVKLAGPNVRFLGAIYDRPLVSALRYHARGYVHGHRVGGTNPSLVESLAAGNPIIAHDNPFTRWVVGDAGRYFTTAQDVDSIIGDFESLPANLPDMEAASRLRHKKFFSHEWALAQYEELLCLFDGPRS